MRRRTPSTPQRLNLFCQLQLSAFQLSPWSFLFQLQKARHQFIVSVIQRSEQQHVKRNDGNEHDPAGHQMMSANALPSGEEREKPENAEQHDNRIEAGPLPVT